MALASPYLQIVLIRLWQSRGGVTLLQHLHIHLRSNTCQGVVQKQNHILTLTHSVLYLPRCSVHCTTVVTLLHSYTRLQLIVLDSHLGSNTYPGAIHSGLSTTLTECLDRGHSHDDPLPPCRHLVQLSLGQITIYGSLKFERFWNRIDGTLL